MGLLSLQEYLAQTLQEANWGLKGYLNQNIIKVKVHLLGRCFCTAGLEQEEALSGTTELLKALLDWTYLSVVLETCGGNVFPPLENRFQPGHPEGRVNQQRLLCLTHHALEHGINIFIVRCKTSFNFSRWLALECQSSCWNIHWKKERMSGACAPLPWHNKGME